MHIFGQWKYFGDDSSFFPFITGWLLSCMHIYKHEISISPELGGMCGYIKERNIHNQRHHHTLVKCGESHIASLKARAIAYKRNHTKRNAELQLGHTSFSLFIRFSFSSSRAADKARLIYISHMLKIKSISATTTLCWTVDKNGIWCSISFFVFRFNESCVMDDEKTEKVYRTLQLTHITYICAALFCVCRKIITKIGNEINFQIIAEHWGGTRMECGMGNVSLNSKKRVKNGRRRSDAMNNHENI